MVNFPNAKINIGLQVLGKRPDNYHNLETVFYPISLCDVLEIIESNDDSLEINYTSSGITVQVEAENNLCIKAYKIFKKRFSGLPPVHIHLHKAIPVGAGLGGGSADAAFTLKLLNEKYSAGFSEDILTQMAAELGSDCAFFIRNVPAIGKGRGEILEPVHLDLSAYDILIVNPGIHINTSTAFKGLSLQQTGISLAEAVKQPLTEWKSKIKNHFEDSIFALYPEIKQVKSALYMHGALYASMSGSGSSVYGIFLKDQQPVLDFPASFFYKWL